MVEEVIQVDVATVAEHAQDRDRRRFDRALLRTSALYLGAGASYVAIGVFFTPFMLSWIIAFAWLLLWVWVVPAVARRLRS